MSNIVPQLADAVTFPLPDKTNRASINFQSENLPPVTGTNYGVHTGKSGLVVIDLDRHDADGVAKFQEIWPGDLPETFTVSTPGNGLHLYFTCDESYDIGRHPNLWPGVDVLGGSGYVAGPGTYREHDGSHDVTGTYTVLNNAPIAPLPETLKTDIKLQKIRKGKDKKPKAVAVEPANGWSRNLRNTEYEQFILRLGEMGLTSSGNNWQCPAHDDRNPSMTVTAGQDKVLAHCHAGCSFDDILEAMKPLSEATEDDDEGLDLVPLSSVTMKRVRWFWDTGTGYPGSGGRIPLGTLNIGVGRPGSGKGQFACWLAANVTNGTLPGELSGQKKGVIFYSTEDSYSMTITPRLAAAGADLDKVYIFSTETENTSGKFVVMKISQHLNRLRKLIEKYDIGLIIFDPLLSAMSSNSDPNNDPSVRGEIEPLQMMLEEAGCTGFGITHFRKMHDDDILNMISGSGAFARVVRSAIAFGAEKDDEGRITRVISCVKNNLGRTDLPSFTYTFEECKVTASDGITYVSKLVMGDETDDSVEEIHERKAGMGRRSKTDLAADWLDEKLSDGPVPKEDIRAAYDAEKPPFSWGTLEKAANKNVFTDKPFGGKASWSRKY